MSIRTLAASSATVAALFAAPAASVAYPVHDVGAAAGTSSPSAAHVTPQRLSTQPALDDSAGGAGTVLVVAIAGATLLIGAAGGFEGGRVVTRRHSVS